jgi:hypothetical protein
VVWHGASQSALQHAARDNHMLFEEFCLHPLVIGNAASCSASDAQHLLRFVMDLPSHHIPTVELGLHCPIQHILDGGVEGWFPTVLKSLVPTLLCMPRAVLWHEEVLQSEGLFPCHTPTAKIHCPSHRLKDRWTVCKLRIQKMGSIPASCFLLRICCPRRCTPHFFASCGVLIGGGGGGPVPL